MAPLEPWERVLVDIGFTETIHGKITCVDCHGGVQSSEKDTAHAGLITDPSQGSEATCATCHADDAQTYATSLHATQLGYWTALETRSIPENHPALEEMFGNHCASCHTSCGDCHISQPEGVGGGLFSGHLFETTPPMTRSCTACHGSRVGNEYLGKHEGIPGDVHFREGRMNCIKCHSGDQMHGVVAEGVDPATIDNRYAGGQMPSCESCHDLAAQAENTQASAMHGVHAENLSCQVCHSITYTSCDGCHVAVSEKSGMPFFETENTYFTFLIGLNPLQDENRPYAYVPLRHVPVSPTSYQYYDENLLPNFDALPTWVYTTPHNIQKSTPQNASCDSCHGHPELFLTADKVAENELLANQSVLVTNLPPDLGSAKILPADHAGRETMCQACHETGTADAPKNPDDHAGRANETCLYCHKLP